MDSFKDANLVKITVKTATAPSYFAPYLINNDSSGLTAIEIQEADIFCRVYGAGTSPVDCKDLGFCHSNDATAYADDVCEYTFLVREGR